MSCSTGRVAMPGSWVSPQNTTALCTSACSITTAEKPGGCSKPGYVGIWSMMIHGQELYNGVLLGFLWTLPGVIILWIRLNRRIIRPYVFKSVCSLHEYLNINSETDFHHSHAMVWSTDASHTRFINAEGMTWFDKLRALAHVFWLLLLSFLLLPKPRCPNLLPWRRLKFRCGQGTAPDGSQSENSFVWRDSRGLQESFGNPHVEATLLVLIAWNVISHIVVISEGFHRWQNAAVQSRQAWIMSYHVFFNLGWHFC